MHTNHFALRYLIEKKDSKPRLIRWVILQQKIYFEVKDKKRRENQLADHLFRFEDEDIPELGEKGEIDDAIADENVLASSQYLSP